MLEQVQKNKEQVVFIWEEFWREGGGKRKAEGRGKKREGGRKRESGRKGYLLGMSDMEGHRREGCQLPLPFPLSF